MFARLALAGCLLFVTATTTGSVTYPPTEVGPSGPASKPAAGLRYGWQTGKNYVYSLHIEGDKGSQISETSGEVWYALMEKRKPTAPMPEAEDEKREGTGSAFAIHSDGYFITCAHVVDRATQIEITLDEKKHTAEVIAIDQERDLAVLKVDANGVPTLRLADSEKVQLGQEARAIGFPMSAILGDSVKVTRGSIAGFIKDRDYGHKVFQIDASLNPGNSGGPLVNEMGEAIGVNFAKLDERLASNVGFATPINFVIDLLKENKIQFDRGSSDEKLSGPRLVRQVAPAVAHLRVTLAPEVPEEILRLGIRSFLRESSRAKGTARTEPRDVRNYLRGRRPVQVDIDERGNVLNAGKSDSLPWLIGNVAEVVLIPFPATRKASWEIAFQTGISFSMSSRTSIPSFSAGRFDRRPRMPRFRGRSSPFSRREPPTVRVETATVFIPAIERHLFHIGEQSEEQVVIHKEIEFKTLANDGLRFEMTAKARVVFDRKAGVPKSMSLTGEMVGRNGSRSEKTPFRLEYALKEIRPLTEDPLALARASSPPPAPTEPRNLPALLRIFEDEDDFAAQLTRGGGAGSLEVTDKYSGTASLKVAPIQIFNPYLKSLNVRIREKPGADEFRYLRFAWRKPAGDKPIGLQIARSGHWDIRYHSGGLRNPWGESTLVSLNMPKEWVVVTRDLFADAGEFSLTGIALDAFDGQYALFDHVYLARSLEDFERLDRSGVAAAEPPESSVAKAEPPKPKTKKGESESESDKKPLGSKLVLRIFDEEADFAAKLRRGFGGGQSLLFGDDKFSGESSLLVKPVQVINARLPGLKMRICEHPRAGEFRYLRFAWKKPAGNEPIGLQLANNGRWGFRYHSGPGRLRWGKSTRINEKLPSGWTVVTRDLFADFGEFTLTGIALDAFDGEYALFDHIYLARSPEDFEKPE